jgi:hypothetical protein
MRTIAMIVFGGLVATPGRSGEGPTEQAPPARARVQAPAETREEAAARLKKIVGVDIDLRATKAGSAFESRREIVVGCRNWDKMPFAFFVVRALPADKEGEQPTDFTGAAAVEIIATGGGWSVIAAPDYDPQMAGKILSALGVTAPPEAEARRLKHSAANWLDLRLAVAQNSDAKSETPRPLANGPSVAQIDEYTKLFKDGGYNAGRRRRDPFLWFPVLGCCEVSAKLVTTAERSASYLLLSDKPDEVLLSGSKRPRPWHLRRVEAVQDAEGRPAVELEFDDMAAERFARLTDANPKRALALLLDDRVVHIQIIDGGWRDTLVVSGKAFGEAMAAGMTRTLRECMVEPEVIADDSDAKPSRSADGARAVELKVVEKVLNPILEAVDPKIKIEFRDQSLVATHLTQNFKIHGRNKRGDFSEKAHDEIGPSSTGFVLKAQLRPLGEVTQAAIPQTLREPYWLTDLDVTSLGKTDKQILWSLSYGSRADKELLDKIRQALKGLKEEQANGAGAQ